jgi:plastocyanin
MSENTAAASAAHPSGEALPRRVVLAGWCLAGAVRTNVTAANQAGPPPRCWPTIDELRRRENMTQTKRSLAVLAAALGLAATGLTAAAAQNGTVTGEVRSRLVRTAPAVVYIEKIPGQAFEPPAEPAIMDQKDLIFLPHVLPVLVGTRVDFLNSDTVRHSVFSTKKSAQQFNLGIYDAGVVKSEVMSTPGAVSLLCNVHAEMSAYIVVVETPYFTTTDETGAFTLDGVPPGSYQLSVWHERLRKATLDVVVEAGGTAPVTFTGLKRR